jgi:hypothetical protein
VIVYVNGDSHSAAAEAVNAYAFAEDDPLYWALGRQPHPDNLRSSYGCELANQLDAILVCEAESAASNTRIMRITRQWLLKNPTAYRDSLVIIQWSTWERQEWLIDGEYFQVNASGIDIVPESHQQQYKEYIAGINYSQVLIDAHEDIWNFHQSLNLLGVKHIFFNGNNSFQFQGKQFEKDWGTSYIKPYDAAGTYHGWLRNNGFETVSKDSWHFGEDAHSAWAKYMLQYIIDNHIL